MQPIGVISVGRSGSTAVMKSIASHPSVVTDDCYPYETFIANHIAKLYGVLLEEQDHSKYPKYGAPAKLIGPFPDYVRGRGTIFDESLEESLNTVIPNSCREIIYCIYRSIARMQHKHPTHFVEKIGAHQVWQYRKLFRELHQIVLVRDFREVLASIKRFNKRRGYKSFGAECYVSYEEYIESSFQRQVLALVKHIDGENGKKLVIRYEDFVAEPAGTLRSIFNFCNVSPVSDEEINEFIVATGQDIDPIHRTSGGEGLATSWETTLTDREQQLCLGAVGPALKRFGYV